MDCLNEVLKTLHLKSSVSCRSELSAPWGVQFPHFPGHAGFSVVARGSCWLEMEGEKKQIALAGGDFVMFPHGSAHVMRDAPGRRAINVQTLLKSHDAAGSKSLSYGGGGALTTLVCGCFEFEAGETNPLISSLPAVIHIKGEDGRAVPWLETTLQYLASETTSGLPGAATVIGHLTDIIFIQAVRAYISGAGECKKGLAKAITDPQNWAGPVIDPQRSNSYPGRRIGSPHRFARRCAGLHKPDGTNSRQLLPDDDYLAAMLA
jgi:cupin